MKQLLLILFSLLLIPASAQETETLYLSGSGLGDTKTWQFYCSAGRNSGKWSKIEVPSPWEQQGFGNYTYGRFYLKEGAKPSDETGTYRYSFKIPAAWQDKQVEIVFEGAMTDTEVSVNGLSAGSLHQGGFYSFRYDITDKIKIGKRNLLEVKVAKESANRSVNAAERRADWWLFGGIYRPVYLEAKPKMNLTRLAIDAQMDGTLNAMVYAKNLTEGCQLALTVKPLGGGQALERKVVNLNATEKQKISVKWNGVQKWDCEHPNLYELNADLVDSHGTTVHRLRERIGFRTIEFRAQDGFYCNGQRITIKGVNRHCFHPNGGRTTNKELSISDVKLIKQMNMNAIRSHYSPDRHLLDVCDSLGLFYLDEFTGWHGHYDTEIGSQLLKEFIAHDMNHPCIFLWSNGNEGGWNRALDSLFAELDLQQRYVVHPWADFNGVDTHHYPAYQTGTARLANGYKVFMPTEFLHAQYDKGAGAGLEDYWENYRRNPMFAGGFIWTFVDEAVSRTDKDGMLDSDGPNGPDGIVGPYREKEGSYYTIREVWAPIKIAPLLITKQFNGEMLVSNRYSFSNLSECTMRYRLWATQSPLALSTAKNRNVALSNASNAPTTCSKSASESLDAARVHAAMTLIGEGEVTLPPINAGETGTARMTVPQNMQAADILELEAYDSHGESICTWTYPIHLTKDYFNAHYNSSISSATTSEERDSVMRLSANGVSVSFSKASGNIITVESNGRQLPLCNGPLPVGMKAEMTGMYHQKQGDESVLIVKYKGAIDSIEWRMKPDGLLSMRAVMLNRGNGGGYKGKFYDEQVYNLGLTFSFPETQTKGVTWLGRGPYRVWKNRIPGTCYGVWHKDYNNTITGESFDALVYPEFKGYHANIYWATIENDAAPFTVFSETDGLYLRLFTPEEPHNRRAGEDCMHAFPAGDISFLLDIPAMRSFKPISEHGPKSQPSTIRIKSGDEGLQIKLWFDFR